MDLVIATGLTQEQYDRVIAAMVEQFGPIPVTPPVAVVVDRDGKVVRAAIPSVPQFTPEEFAMRQIWRWTKERLLEAEQNTAVREVKRVAEQKAKDDFSNV